MNVPIEDRVLLVQILRSRIRLLLLATTLLIAGCSTAGLGLDPRTGVSIDSQGEIRLLYALCPGEEMHVVEVAESIGGGSDFAAPIYWRIESPSGSTQREYIVGVTPDEFVETVPLDGPLPADERLSIGATRRSMGMSFQVNRLVPGEVLRGYYDEVDEQTFETQAAADCRREQLVAGSLWLLAPGLIWLVALQTQRIRRSHLGTGRKALILSIVLGGAGSFVGALVEGAREYDTGITAVAAATLIGVVGGASVGSIVGALMGISARIGRSSRAQLLIGMVAVASLITLAVIWPQVDFQTLEADLTLWGVALALTSWLAVMSPKRSPGISSTRKRILRLVAASVLSAATGLALLTSTPPPLSPAAESQKPLGSFPSNIETTGDIVLDVTSDKPTASFTIDGGAQYNVQVACEGASAQISEGYRLSDRAFEIRRVLPCDASVHSGAADAAPDQTKIELFVRAIGSGTWRLIVTRP